MSNKDSSVVKTYRVPLDFKVESIDLSTTHLMLHAVSKSSLHVLTERIFVYKLSYQREYNFPYFSACPNKLLEPSEKVGKVGFKFVKDDLILLLVANGTATSSIYKLVKLGGHSFSLGCTTRKCLETASIWFSQDIRFPYNLKRQPLLTIFNPKKTDDQIDQKN